MRVSRFIDELSYIRVIPWVYKRCKYSHQQTKIRILYKYTICLNQFVHHFCVVIVFSNCLFLKHINLAQNNIPVCSLIITELKI